MEHRKRYLLPWVGDQVLNWPQILGTLDLKGRGRIDTKVFPNRPGYHKAERLKNDMKKSVQDLGPHKIRVFYLHAPDHATPFEETLEAVNDLYKQGVLCVLTSKFIYHAELVYSEEFGLSNFMSWEVAEVVGICVRRGFVTPTVYEGFITSSTGHQRENSSHVFANSVSDSLHIPLLLVVISPASIWKHLQRPIQLPMTTQIVTFTPGRRCRYSSLLAIRPWQQR